MVFRGFTRISLLDMIPGIMVLVLASLGLWCSDWTAMASCGAWWWDLGGDGSKDLHSLIKILGESVVAARSRARGLEGAEGELGLVLGQTRRRLSCTFVQAQALCLLARLGQLGRNARMAADRGKEASRVETERRREAQAHWLAHVRGRGLGRAGMIFVP